MSVYNNTYDNEINVPLSMTGEKKLKVSQIDFDTSCDCQVTACDGGTIKFCAPVHFDPVPWPPHPEPGGHGACPPGVPLDLVVTKKIEFDTSGTCQIESCPVVTDPITMCSPLILTEDLGTIYGVDNCKCGRMGKYFKVHGRIKSAETRGCSDTYS